MGFLKVLRSSFFQIISIIFIVFYLLGVLNIHFSDKNNYCVMTYMYEYPQFVRISVPENKLYPQYGLYAYSEGRLTENARKMWFDGIPVIFIPGNSGSHMQARSLASVALRKALSKGYDFHFDYFTISYNEELSGVYGGVLLSQTKFAAACVAKVLSLYKNNKYTKTVPNSVILIGHSMGGLIAKRLLAYPSTINTTNIAITLASPLQGPVFNFDIAINEYYMLMDYEWRLNIQNNEEYRNKKVLISFGNGPRDILMPSGLTSSNDSYINALTTSVPGVWVSPDHVCIVWCKQLVMAVNKYLFSIISPYTAQITEDQTLIKDKARQFFVANRSMTLNPDIPRANVTMIADAFWYEDNRRIYQVTRPDIDKTTHLMIRLVKFPQNRFVAVEAVNIEDRDWVFGCNAKFTFRTHRYCKHATSLTELSRWTGAATDFGRRKIATINLHKIMELHPDWTHVVVKVSPVRRPITLNVDINDHASRQITIDTPSSLSFYKTTIIHETERDSLYYEILLRNFDAIHQAYLLYVEPTASCKATQYHVSAEVNVPWADNHEYYHYFTHAKRSPMKLRLYKSNPNVTAGVDATEFVKITLLLDPQCTYTVSISTTWYHRLAQFARNYSTVLVPYVAAIILLVARHNITRLRNKDACESPHTALNSDSVKPYYALVFARLGLMVFTSLPLLSFLFENASFNNAEMQYFTRSILVLPAYLTALGLLNVSVAVILVVMVFSSQIAHRLLFRILWRGGTGLAEKVASGLQKVPMVVSATLVCAAPLSCGAAALAAGASFYAFLLSKMYEEYLEDYFYKIIAKIGSKICRMFKKQNKKEKAKIDRNSSGEEIKWRNLKEMEQDCFLKKQHENRDEDLSNINFHMTMFLMWIIVTAVNVPALLTWARNFKYSTTLKPDTSYYAGLSMAVCSTYIWQMDGPRKNLRCYDAVSSLIFTMAVFILVLGPFSLAIVNYGVTLMFTIITAQQVLDKENIELSTLTTLQEKSDTNTNECENKMDGEQNGAKGSDSEEKCNGTKDNHRENDTNNENSSNPSEQTENNCDVCNEGRIYTMFKNLREKFTFDDDL